MTLCTGKNARGVTGRGCRAHRQPLRASLPGRGHTVTPACATLTCTNDQHIGAAQVVVAQGDALCHHLCPPLCLKSLCHHHKKRKAILVTQCYPGQAGRDGDNCSSVINQLEDSKPLLIQIPFQCPVHCPLQGTKVKQIHHLLQRHATTQSWAGGGE